MSSLAVKIAKASMIVGGKLTPDKRNLQDRYEYVSADQILSAGGQALAEAGVACFPSVTSAEVMTFDRGGGKNRYDARVNFVFIMEDEESTLELVWVGYGSDYTVPDKAIYKAITSGHRYFLAKLLNIGAGNEDGEHESGEGDNRKSVATNTVAGSINNGSSPCPVCFAPVGKVHLPKCTASGDPQSKEKTQPVSISSLDDVDPIDFDPTGEFLAIPSQEAGMVNGQPVGKTKAVQATKPVTPEFVAFANGVVEWALKTQRGGDTPCSEPQYGYLVSVINKITGVADSHHSVLSVLTGRPTSSENRVDKKLAGELLDYLTETKTAKAEDGTKTQVKNEEHKTAYVAVVKWIHSKAATPQSAWVSVGGRPDDDDVDYNA